MGRMPVFNLLSCVKVRGRNKRSQSCVCIVFSVLGLLISVYEIGMGILPLSPIKPASFICSTISDEKIMGP